MNFLLSQLFIWFLVVFYIVLGTALILKGAVIAQTLYNVAQKLSHMEYGWLIILGFMSASSLLSDVSRYAPSSGPDDLTPVVRSQSLFHSHR